MIPLTLVVTLVVIGICMPLNRVCALGVLIASMFLYPEYLRVPIGLSAMSAPRFVAIVLLIRLLLSPAKRQFKWKLIDTVVLAAWVWTVFANIVAGAEFQLVGETIGKVFDTVLIYFVARLSLAGDADYGKLLLPLTVTAYVMCAAGVVEAVTTKSPYEWMRAFENSVWFVKADEFRFGLLRAQGSMSHPIYFGMANFLLLGILFAIRGYCKSKMLWASACIAAFFAALSSMSSGPQQALVLLILANAFYLRPRLLKPALTLIVLAGIAMELASNRHFWYLTEYVNFFGGDYWYRAKLIDVAIAQWRDYWLIGVGSNTPDHWGLLIDGRTHVDLVNQYVIIAVNGGFLGLTLYAGSEILALREVVRGWRTTEVRRKQLVFGLGATMVALIIASVSVGLFSVPLLMSYILTGMMVGEPGRQTQQTGAGRRQFAVLRRRRGRAMVN